MPFRPPSELHRPAIGSSSLTGDELIRLLAGPFKIGKLEPGDNAESEEILLDIELDGYRYLLVRVPKPVSVRVSLSPREKEIVRMVAQGHPNKVIAGVLNISGWTVCTHLRRIFAKLGVGSRAAMVAKLFDVSGLNNRVAASPTASHSSAAIAPKSSEASRRPEEKLAARAGRG